MSSSLSRPRKRPRDLESLPAGEGGSSRSSSTFPMRGLGSLPVGEGGTSLDSATLHGIRQVSDSVYDLGPHVVQPRERPEVEVVFIHGLQLSDYRDAYWNTWIGGEKDDGKAVCWPIAWLGEDLPGARIWSLSYDACALSTETTGKVDLFLAAESLVQDMVDAKIGQRNCPVVFVCHCLGGLVVKEIVTIAHRKSAKEGNFKKFLQNIRGFHFYNTPHDGSKLADLAEHLPNMGKLVGQLKVINNHLRRLNSEFEGIERDYFPNRWLFSVIFGKNATSWGGQSGMVVEEASARHAIQRFLTVDADHFEVCMPKSKMSSSYQHVWKFIEDIVKANKVRDPIPFELPRFVQGMEERVQRVSEELDKHSVVGLVGMGGIGKTTLSKYVFVERRGSYDESCYLEDVKSDIYASQKQLFRELCHEEWRDDNVREQLQKIKSCILTEKVLVVVDNVDAVSQLEALKVDAFKDGKDGSKVIVTSRRRDILTLDIWGSEDGIIDVEGLSGDEALSLFSDYAFSGCRDKTRVVQFDGLAGRIVEACRGLPLSLEVIGQFLRRKYRPGDENAWEGIWREALLKLKAAEPLEGNSERDILWAKLRISYDDMDGIHQSLFLDFACILSEVHLGRGDLGRIWGSMIGVDYLIDRSLLTWRRNKETLVMHDQLRDLGRSIASLDKSRIWRKDEGLNLILQDDSCIALEGLSLVDVKDNDYKLGNLEVLEKLKLNASLEFQLHVSREKKENMDEACKEKEDPSMKNLRLLNLQESDIRVVKYYLQLCTKKLNWLRLNSTEISCNDLKKVRSFQNLRVLQMRSCKGLKELPHDVVELLSLTELDLDHCCNVKTLPVRIGDLKSLQVLMLGRCSIVELPESIGQLTQLQRLHLNGCSSLEQLPESLGQLSQLGVLILDGCSSLVQLPESLGQLSQLEELSLDGCSSLVQVPESLGQLSQLGKLSLGGCSSLLQVPESLGQLSQLSNWLSLAGCSSLVQLPESLGQLSQLGKLSLNWCSSLVWLPESLGQLSQLGKLSLAGCSSLVQLPESLGQLSQLGKLSLAGCSSLVQLPKSLGQLSQLGKLSLDGCSSLVQLPESLGQLSQLSNWLSLRGCSSLVQLPESLGQLSQLEELSLDWCSSLVQLPESLGQLSQLGKLSLDWCSSLEQLPESLGQLSQLQWLSLDGCSSLVQLPESLGQLSQLQWLSLDGCSSLVQLPESLG